MSANPSVKAVTIWDPVVRLSHWVIALSVLANAVFTKGGSALHVWIGWAAMALLLLRLIWGFAGSREARFSAFPPRPLAALGHLRDLVRGKPRDYGTHNPAGALMAYALWGLLALVVATGLIMTGGATPMQVQADQDAVASGDWGALVRDGESGEDEDEDGGLADAAGEVHEVAANLILILAALHVAGVFAESRALRRNLVAPMLAGSRGTKGRPRRS